jgi:hypothetical protein
MLVLIDRGFDAASSSKNPPPPARSSRPGRGPTAACPRWPYCHDGSHLSRIDELTVRTTAVEVTLTRADGTRHAASHRLTTTLRDPRRHPLDRGACAQA